MSQLQDIISNNLELPFAHLAQDAQLTQQIQGLLGLAQDGSYGTLTQQALEHFKITHGLAGGDFLGVTTARALLTTPSSLVARSTANAVYGTALSDQQFTDLNATLSKFGIHTLEDIREFLAQTAHESGGLQWLVEGWGPTAEQQRYENDLGLGNQQPGDGYRFRGGGAIQLTGRSNYQAFADAIGDPHVLQGADYVAQHYPFRSAGFYWYTNGISQVIAEGAGLVQVSALINCGDMSADPNQINGLASREAYYVTAKHYITG